MIGHYRGARPDPVVLLGYLTLLPRALQSLQPVALLALAPVGISEGVVGFDPLVEELERVGAGDDADLIGSVPRFAVRHRPVR